MKRFPSKASALRFILEAGVEVGAIIDVGVMHMTRPLMEAFPRHRHLLFEPMAEYEASIRHYYKDLDYELTMVAVSDRIGTRPLEVNLSMGTADPASYKQARIVDTPAPGLQVREIPTITLDDFLASRNEPKPYLLKIDVDGHEMAILRGALRTLANTACLIVEVYTGNWSERQAFIESLGFHLVDVVDLHYFRGRFAQADLVFLRGNQFTLHPNLNPGVNGPWDWSKWQDFSAGDPGPEQEPPIAADGDDPPTTEGSGPA